MKKLMKKFEDIMSAATFAEAGEFETARELVKGRQKVLLTLTERETDTKSFRYALNICKRIGAGLEILYVTRNSKMIDLLDQFRSELKEEEIPFEIIQGSGCIKEAIVNYAEKKKDIQFVVIESSGTLELDCKKEDRVLSKAWARLKCPLVVVGA